MQEDGPYNDVQDVGVGGRLIWLLNGVQKHPGLQKKKTDEDEEKKNKK
jgi:hypothetical protein